jgi:hypothetical protein
VRRPFKRVAAFWTRKCPAVVAAVLCCAGCAESAPTLTSGVTSVPFYEREIAQGMYRVEGGKLVRQRFRSEPQAMDPLAWIAGDWDVAGVIFATSHIPETPRRSSVPQKWSIDRQGMTIYSEPYGKPEQRSAEVSWDPYARQWVSVLTPPYGYGVMTGAGWRGDRLDLIGKVTFPGGDFVMRHSFVRLSQDSFEIQNSERLPDGSWRPIDKHVFTRRSQAPPGEAHDSWQSMRR